MKYNVRKNPLEATENNRNATINRLFTRHYDTRSTKMRPVQYQMMFNAGRKKILDRSSLQNIWLYCVLRINKASQNARICAESKYRDLQHIYTENIGRFVDNGLILNKYKNHRTSHVPPRNVVYQSFVSVTTNSHFKVSTMFCITSLRLLLKLLRKTVISLYPKHEHRRLTNHNWQGRPSQIR